MIDPHAQDADETVDAASSSGEPAQADSSAVTADFAALRDALSRAQADYANLLKRTESDRRAIGVSAVKTVALRILPFVDNLERALATVPAEFADHAWVGGIRGMYQKLLKDFESFGIVPFDSVGQETDPHRHEVLAQAPGEAGVVVSEFERGYLLHGEVLRHAKVVVGSGPDIL